MGKNRDVRCEKSGALNKGTLGSAADINYIGYCKMATRKVLEPIVGPMAVTMNDTFPMISLTVKQYLNLRMFSAVSNYHQGNNATFKGA